MQNPTPDSQVWGPRNCQTVHDRGIRGCDIRVGFSSSAERYPIVVEALSSVRQRFATNARRSERNSGFWSPGDNAGFDIVNAESGWRCASNRECFELS